MDDIIALRRELHQNPELSGKEFQTAAKIKDFIHSKAMPDQTLTLAGHGLAFIYKGESQGPVILIRCELDALPIQETNNFDHRSFTKGISHKCGHDGHMAILAAVGKHFSTNRPKSGQVILLYQPAEETGEGARAVFEDPVFQDINPDYVFALHNVPGYKPHLIRCKTGCFTPAVTSLAIALKGKTSHAAEPHKGLNPGRAVSHIIQKAQDISDNAPPGSIITLIHILVGEKAYGVSAGDGEIHFTLRGVSNKDLSYLLEGLKTAARSIAHKDNLEINFSEFESFHANMNDEIAVEIIKLAADNCSLEYETMEEPNPWGEDFGYINSNHIGAMFGLGAGEASPALHNPDYDFPDDLIETGSKMFIEITNQIFKEQEDTGQQTMSPQSAKVLSSKGH